MNPAKPTPPNQRSPSSADIDTLIALFNTRHYTEAESRTRSLLEQYPQFGFGWKLLGGTQQMQGKDAQPAFQKVVELMPNDAEAHYNLGVILKSKGQLNQAATSYQRAITLKPDYAEAHSNLGNTLKDLGQLKDALASYRRALKLKPDSADTHNNLGTALKDLGQLNDALTSYRQAIALQPDFAWAHYNLGNAQKQLGQLDEALHSYRRAITLKPDFADAHNNLGSVFKDLGQFTDALDSYRRVLELKPDYAEAHNNLGVALKNLGQLDAALARYHKAVELKPDYADAHNNLGTVLQTLGQPAAALISYRRAVELDPDFAEAHSNLGNTLKELGQLDEALASCRRALEINPDYAEAHNNLGIALKELGQLDAALASYRRALQIKPDFAEAYNNSGSVLKELDQLDAAVASYRHALQLKPDYAEAHSNLGIALQYIGQLDEAVASYRRALEIKPDYAEAHSNLGAVLQNLGQPHAALTSCQRAVELKPDSAEAYNTLGIVLQTLRQFDSALVSFRRAVELKPDSAEGLNNLSGALSGLGQFDEALASYRRALELKPDYGEARSNLLFFYGYHDLINPHEYLAEARGWELACVPARERQAAHDKTFNRLPLAGRRLRVGYVSGDFRQHAVSYFIEQLFAHHDRSRVELFAYSNSRVRDAITERLQALVEHWIPLTGVSDATARERIEADGIDVLIDLSGHTGHNRLGIFARRAAPVQAYYLGYFASTGLTEMDYWIGDEILNPPETDSHFSEQVWRLPRISWSYDAKDAPTPAWRPDPDGAVWIGSFNNLSKLTHATLALWAKVLHLLPEGRLLLKTNELADAGNRQRILDAMAGHGIPSNRIELQSRSATPDWSAHMAYYDRLDIALDPIGAMGGVTTTFDALWMAVPVIAMQGNRVASRATAAILGALGHTEWIAHTEAEYIDKVVALARDAEQRKTLRHAQRERMALSPLCDAKGLAVNLENAYNEMFERWMQRQNGRRSIAS
jgi:protein O-GlcNAc transferase